MSTRRPILLALALLLLVPGPARATPSLFAAARELPPGLQRQVLGGLPAPALVVREAGAVTWTSMSASALQASTLPWSTLSVGATLVPLLDQARHLVGADTVFGQDGLAGRGVVVAVVDTGIDVRHEDFRNPDGTTRIAWLLDLSRAPVRRHPELEDRFRVDQEGQARGAVFDAADLDAMLREGGDLPGDEVGHGTYVLSIAAGNGRATGRGQPAGRYVGIAPDATLVAVRASPAGQRAISDAALVAGVAFACDRAEALGMPVVVNLSVGTQRGTHDGRSPLERALSSLVPEGLPGRALVAAAGNDGGRLVHAYARLVQGPVTALPLRVSEALAAGPGDVTGVELVFEGRAAIAVRWPDGTVSPFVPPGRASGYTTGGAVVSIANATEGADPDTGTRVADVLLAGGGETQRTRAGGTYEILLRGEGRVDAYVFLDAEDRSPGRQAVFASPLAVGWGTLAVPASSPDVVSVGSVSTRPAWTGADGPHRYEGSLEGTVSGFSGLGPNRLGELRPDLVAPGEVVIAALSHQARGPATGGFFLPGGLAEDGEHVAAAGTSSAAPLVAGAMALLLQIDPTLSQRDLATALAAGARQTPAGGEPRWNPAAGWGVLDIPAALDLVRRRRDPPRATVASGPSDFITAAPILDPEASTLVAWRLVDAAGRAVQDPHVVTLRASAGWCGPVQDRGGGRYVARYLASGLRRGDRVTLRATVDGTELEPRTIRIGGTDPDDLRPVVSGCSATARMQHRSGWPVLVLAACLMATRSTRRSLRRVPGARNAVKPQDGSPPPPGETP